VQEYLIRKGRKGYPPEEVGEIVWHALTASKPHVRYAMETGGFISRLIARLLPKRVVDRIIARNLGFKV
jgi:hypothetical protein